MSEPYLTMAEIEKKYPNEWVLLDDVKSSRCQEILGGRVLMHCADRAEFHRRFPEWDDGGSSHRAVWYIGKEPEPEFLPLDTEPGAA